MRRLVAPIVVIASATSALAQAPQPPAPPAADPALVAHLRGWEDAMTKSKSFYSPTVAVRTNAATGQRDVYKGSVMCLKGGYAKTRLELQPAAGQPANATQGVYEEYVITPAAVHEYTGEGLDRTTGKMKPQNYTETQFAGGQRPRNVMLDFLSGGMTADMAMKRFDIRLVKTDATYIYLTIMPKAVADKEDFQAMTMALYQPATGFGYLPAMVSFTKDALGQRVEEWSFTQPVLNHQNIVPQQFVPHAVKPNDPAWVVTRRIAGPGGMVPAPAAAAGGTLPPRK